MLTAMPPGAIAVAITALALTGCGSTSTTPPSAATVTVAPVPAATVTPSSTPAVTHAAFVRALNASCAKMIATGKPLKPQIKAASASGDFAALERLNAKTNRILRAHVERIAHLQPPAKDRDAFRLYMRSERRLLDLGKRLGRSLRDADWDRAEQMADTMGEESERRLTAAIDMGADKCGG